MLDRKSAIVLTVSETPATASEFEVQVDVLDRPEAAANRMVAGACDAMDCRAGG